MTGKNVYQFATANWGDYKTTVSVASKSSSGIPLVESDFEIYNFDTICQSLFPGTENPTSADGIRFSNNNIQLIEFKSGFKQKITKNNFDIEQAKCDETGKVCDSYWELFWDNQKRKIKELISVIRLKAIESYVVLEKHVLPACDDNETGKLSRIKFTVVIDEDSVDGIEDTLAELSGTEPETNNVVTSVRQALKRLSNCKDLEGHTYFYDEIEVLTAKDYQNSIKLAM